jgi:hypothetical protein
MAFMTVAEHHHGHGVDRCIIGERADEAEGMNQEELAVLCGFMYEPEEMVEQGVPEHIELVNYPVV